MKNMLLFCSLFISAATTNALAANCAVKDADIANDYSGACQNGLANGKGTAVGRDRYVGEFRDGEKNGKGVYTWANGSRYEGEYSNDRKDGFGTLRMVRGDPGIQSWEKDGKGKWVGDNYVVQGMFNNGNNLARSCASVADCKNKEREEYAQRERSNNEACNRLYPGKPVTMKYGQGQFLGPFYANAVIVGVGRGVASARVIGGSAYESDGYGIGSVHERSCIDF